MLARCATFGCFYAIFSHLVFIFNFYSDAIASFAVLIVHSQIGSKILTHTHTRETETTTTTTLYFTAGIEIFIDYCNDGVTKINEPSEWPLL